MRLGTQYQPDGRGRDTFIFREPLLVHGKHGPTHLLAEPIYPVRDRLEMRYSQTKTRFRDVSPKVETWRTLPTANTRDGDDGFDAATHTHAAHPHPSRPRPRSTDAQSRRSHSAARLPHVDVGTHTGPISARKAPVWKHTPVARDPDGADVVKHSNLSGIAHIRDSYDPTPKLPPRKISATVERLYKNHLYEPRQEDFEGVSLACDINPDFAKQSEPKRSR